MRFSWEALDLKRAEQLHARAYRLEDRVRAEALAPTTTGILEFGPGYYFRGTPLLSLPVTRVSRDEAFFA